MASEDRKIQHLFFQFDFLLPFSLFPEKNQSPHVNVFLQGAISVGFPFLLRSLLFLPGLAFKIGMSSSPILTPFSSHPPARRGGQRSRMEELRAGVKSLHRHHL